MDSETENLEKKLTSLLDQLHLESGILQRMVYKNKNQHRRSFYFQFLLQVRRDLRLLQSAKLEELISSCFQVISGKKAKQKIYLLESLKRRKCEVGKFNFMERLLGAARLLSEMVEPIFKAASEIYSLVSRAFFTGFSFTILALLARIRVLVQQILLDVVLVFNMVSSLSQQKQAVKINQRGTEVYREFYPSKDEFFILECVWKEDRFILEERKQKIKIGNQEEHLGPNVSLASSAVRYQSIESLLADDESTMNQAEAAKIIEEGQVQMKLSENHLVASPSKKVNGVFIKDDTETGKNGSTETLLQESCLVVNSSSSIGAKKFKSKKPAFVSVKNPQPIILSAERTQFKETKVDSEDREDPFFSLLTGGKAKGSLF